MEKYGHLANHLPNFHVDRQKNDHLPTHKQHLITTKKLENKKVIDFALANELFWETNTLGYSYRTRAISGRSRLGAALD